MGRGQTVTRTCWRMLLTSAAVLAVLGLTACGSGPSEPTGVNADRFDLAIDGVSQSIVGKSAARTNPGFSGVTVEGSALQGGAQVSFKIAIPDGTTVGTIGPGQKLNSNLDIVTSTSAGWVAFDTLGSGTVTVTMFTTARIAGSFDLFLGPTTTSAIGTRHATGSFDLAIQ